MEYFMNKIFCVAIILLLAGCNAAYNKAVKEQLAAGYKWVKIPCRPAKPDVPSFTVDGPNGQKLVCYVLRK